MGEIMWEIFVLHFPSTQGMCIHDARSLIFFFNNKKSIVYGKLEEVQNKLSLYYSENNLPLANPHMPNFIPIRSNQETSQI